MYVLIWHWVTITALSVSPLIIMTNSKFVSRNPKYIARSSDESASLRVHADNDYVEENVYVVGEPDERQGSYVQMQAMENNSPDGDK